MGGARPPPTWTMLLAHRRYSCAMRPLRYSINVTSDGCCDHRATFADEELHRHAVENLDQAEALLSLFAGPSKRVDLKLASRLEFGSGAVAMRYEPRRVPSGLPARVGRRVASRRLSAMSGGQNAQKADQDEKRTGGT